MLQRLRLLVKEKILPTEPDQDFDQGMQRKAKAAEKGRFCARGIRASMHSTQHTRSM